MKSEQKQFRFPARMRLHGRAAFQRVFNARTVRSRGPLVVYLLQNDVGYPRLGLTVSRRVGGAVRRNRIKRLLRESFRSIQHDFREGYDVVVVLRPHRPMTLERYDALLRGVLHSHDALAGEHET